MKSSPLPTTLILFTLLLLTPLQLSSCQTTDDPPMAGGVNRIDVKNTFLLDALAAVQPQMMGQLDSLYVHRMGAIKEASSQVVAGLKFYVTFELLETACLKAASTPTTNVDTCAPTKAKSCEAEILVQSWLNNNELLEFNCKEVTPA